MLLCWTPALLAGFPGLFAYDATQEWREVSEWAITAHHPVAHVLLLGGVVEGLYRLTGSYNLGITVYTIAQMVVVAATFSATIKCMEEFRVPRWFCGMAILFYGLSPVIQLFSICSTKDVLFSVFCLRLFLDVLYFCCKKDMFFRSKKRMSGFVLAALGTMIFRNNGLYIVIVMLLVMVFSCRKYWKKYIPMTLVILLVYGLYVGPVYRMLSVTKGGIQEMFSVPLQQMARVHKYDYEELKPEELELLYQVVSKEVLDTYRSTVSDPIKTFFDREGFEENKVEFLKLWIKWGVEHPMTYINSFLVGTVDFWYPCGVVDGYQDPYGRSSFFLYDVEYPGTEKSLWPELREFYLALSTQKEMQQKPFAFLLLNPGWYFVVTFTVFMFLWAYRKRGVIMPFGILILNMLTVFLGPIALVRYVLILYFVCPIVISVCFYSDRYGESIA